MILLNSYNNHLNKVVSIQEVVLIREHLIKKVLTWHNKEKYFQKY
jgi:hypothetical protein